MSARFALVAVGLVLVAFFAPILGRGRVVFPHDNALQVGLVGEGVGDGEASNLRFSDQSSFYVPELEAHLSSPRSGWIATWTNAVQMGRPMTHLSGFSPAYPPTWVAMRFSDDPFVLYTWIFAMTLAATAAFAFAFFRALGLDPWICTAGACSAAFGVPVLYWSTFLMNASGICWTFCLLWLVTRQVERPGLARAIGIACATGLLLLSAYPQHVVWHGAFLAAWTLHRIVRTSGTVRSRSVVVMGLGASVVGGVLAAAPVLVDIALALARSARTEVDPDFFVSALPRVESFRALVAQFALLVDPRIVGDPIHPDFPLGFKGICFGPLIALALCLSWWRGAWRDHLPAYLLLAVSLGMLFVPGLFRWGVEHLGLSLSRTLPSWGALVPAIVCGTMTLDRVVRDGRGLSRTTVATWCVAIVAGVVGLRVACDPWILPGGERGWLVTLALVVGGTVALVVLRRAWLIAVIACAIVFAEGSGLVLERPRAGIRTTSPLVEGLQERVRSGGRYAIVGDHPKFTLPANQELLLGLASVHSYDSLSPQTYQQWVLRLSVGGTRVYGRRFNRIQDESLIAAGELEKAGVTHVVSGRAIRAPNLTPDVALGPFLVYRTKAEVAPALVLPAARVSFAEGGAASSGTWTRAEFEHAQVLEDLGDRVRVHVDADGAERWLVLRRQFHPQWVAHDGSGRELDCMLVDGFYQGVRVPNGVDEVELEFRPWARFAWVPWPAFVLLFALVTLTSRRRAT
ncbi:MAG: hypothetical protein IPJ77_10280 [Planctomycetes bacterium]|nr:hypothetical protein [Planctomycetota bacterium]